MAASNSETPVRDYMDDPKIQWRTKKPDFHSVNEKYLKEKTKSHPVGSLEKVVENLVKTWEMESTHKVNTQDWSTVSKEVYYFSTNCGPRFDLEDNIRIGNYNMMLENSPLFDVTKETNDSSMALFKSCFPGGFAWELLELYSGPPTVVFTWRHWGTFEGPFRGKQPTNKTIEMKGSAIVKVDDKLKITDLQVFFDPNPVVAELVGHTPHACPFSIHHQG